jgi:hypothetical protein
VSKSVRVTDHAPSAASMAQPSVPLAATDVDSMRCLNCDSVLTGKYCSACGQKLTDRDPRLRELAHEAADEFLHWDGKLVETMSALFRRPGFLTKEYLAGRRARYVSPLRLYLTASVIYFAVLALVPRSNAIKIDLGPNDGKPTAAKVAASEETAAPKDNSYRARKRAAFERIARDPAKFREALKHNQPKAMFVLLPVFALALGVLYRRYGRYPAHFIFALHFHAFAFLLLAVVTAPAALSEKFDVLEPVAFVAVAVYLVLALRRVYGQGRLLTLAKTGALAGVYLFAFTFTLLALIALTALTF